MPRAPNPAPALDQTAAVDLLCEASVMIAAYRTRLRTAGYPFPEVPGTARIITEIDALTAPLLVDTNKSDSLSIPVFGVR